jgi:hypothetical protein
MSFSSKFRLTRSGSNLSRLGAAFLTAAAASAAQAVTVVDFSDLSLAPQSFHSGSTETNGFFSAGAFFNNSYDATWGSWGGWAYSNVIDTTTPGWGNQFAAIPGSGPGTSGIYAVAYVDDFTPTVPTITLPGGTLPVSLKVSNTTYAYYSMLEGDDFSKKFGGEDGNDADFFLLTITGLDSDGGVTGQVEVFLADYRFLDNSQNYILNEWTVADLSSLGSGTTSLRFLLSSSDEGAFGMQTPAYFALGELVLIPEPATAALALGAAGFGLILLRRRTSRR